MTDSTALTTEGAPDGARGSARDASMERLLERVEDLGARLAALIEIHR
jgi:hypothetical protein